MPQTINVVRIARAKLISINTSIRHCTNFNGDRAHFCRSLRSDLSGRTQPARDRLLSYQTFLKSLNLEPDGLINALRLSISDKRTLWAVTNSSIANHRLRNNVMISWWCIIGPGDMSKTISNKSQPLNYECEFLIIENLQLSATEFLQ